MFLNVALEILERISRVQGSDFLLVFKIRWVLEDQIVSALLHSGAIATATLHKVAAHIVHSSGRPHCHSEDVPLQFVFGPEQSLEKFKEALTHLHTHTK